MVYFLLEIKELGQRRDRVNLQSFVGVSNLCQVSVSPRVCNEAFLLYDGRVSLLKYYYRDLSQQEATGGKVQTLQV